MAKNEKAKKVNVKEKSRKDVKNKKHFGKDFRAELKKVVWPTSKQLVNSTVAVITIVLVCALIVFLLDLAFEAINKYGINKMQSALQAKYSTSVEENTTSETADEASSANESTTEDANK